MNKSYLEAKKMFLNYQGNHFLMEKEGEYQRYKQFNISHEQEILWISEYSEFLLYNIKNNKIITSEMIYLFNAIKMYKLTECFRNLLDWVQQNFKNLDTFTNIRIVEELGEIIEAYEKSNLKNNDEIRLARSLSLEILILSKNQEITVNPLYESIDFLQGCLNEDTIKKRIEMRIKKFD